MVVTWFSSGALWIIYRSPSLPLDIDESGYIGFAVRNCQSFMSGGVWSFLTAVLSRGTFAPLQPFIGTVFGCATNPNIELFIPLLASSFFIWEFMRLQKHPFFGLLIIFVCPVYLQYSTNFGFTMLSSTAFALSALYSVHSNFFKNFRYSIFSGIALCVALLTRTMFSAFFVVEIVADILMLLLFWKQNLLLRIRNFLISLGFSSFLALPWYVTHWKSVFGYLTSFGYGVHAKEYGRVSGIFNWATWKFEWQVFSQTYFTRISILGILLLLGLLVYQATKKLRRCAKQNIPFTDTNSKRLSLLRIENQSLPVIFYLLLCIGMLIAMSSTVNVTVGGLLPTLLVTGLVISHVTGFSVVPNFLSAVGSSTVYIILICVCLMEFSSNPILKIGGSTYIKAASARSEYYKEHGFASPGSSGVNSANSNKWVSAINNLAQSGRMSHCLVFGFRHPILNVNSVELQLYYEHADLSYVTQIDPIQTSSSAEYDAWVKSFPVDCLVFTDDSAKGQFPPAPNFGLLKQALIGQAYSSKRIVKLPDGSLISEWRPTSK